MGIYDILILQSLLIHALPVLLHLSHRDCFSLTSLWDWSPSVGRASGGFCPLRRGIIRAQQPFIRSADIMIVDQHPANNVYAINSFH